MLRELAGDFIYGADGFLNKNICGGRSGEGGKTRCLFFPLQILGVTQRFYDPVYPGIKSIRSQYDADKGPLSPVHVLQRNIIDTRTLD